jgi:hypothetical protein
MKKVLFAVAILTSTFPVFGWEHPNNPDRFPSLGLSYTGIAEDGDYKTQGFSQDIESSSAALILDTRLPLSNSFTLSLGLGATGTNVKGESNAVFDADELDTSGGLFTISGRYYFNK